MLQICFRILEYPWDVLKIIESFRILENPGEAFLTSRQCLAILENPSEAVRTLDDPSEPLTILENLSAFTQKHFRILPNPLRILQNPSEPLKILENPCASLRIPRLSSEFIQIPSKSLRILPNPSEPLVWDSSSLRIPSECLHNPSELLRILVRILGNPSWHLEIPMNSRALQNPAKPLRILQNLSILKSPWNSFRIHSDSFRSYRNLENPSETLTFLENPSECIQKHFGILPTPFRILQNQWESLRTRGHPWEFLQDSFRFLQNHSGSLKILQNPWVETLCGFHENSYRMPSESFRPASESLHILWSLKNPWESRRILENPREAFQTPWESLWIPFGILQKPTGYPWEYLGTLRILYLEFPKSFRILQNP